MDIKEAEILGAEAGNHWYYRSKAEAVEHCLRGVAFETVLDVGAGSGYFSRHLLAHSAARRSYCVDPNYSHDWQESVAGKPLAFLRNTDTVNADLVLLMDVMEHVDDDVALLREYAQKSLPSAAFLISVPAFQWLWSTHDVFLGHRRRYTLRHLENVVRAAGLEVVSGSYYYASIFPLAATIRFFRRNKMQNAPATSDLRRHGRLVNSALHMLCRCEMTAMKYNRAFGLTAFCLARRRC